ncbi:MAG: gliding motility protein GldC [Ferruginibacter sp.]
MQHSSININVVLDPQKVPQQITWNATDSNAEMTQKAKALCLAFWDAEDKTALRIDLWTKDMMVDEMGDFYYQMFITMADSFKRATHQAELAEDLKTFANQFQEKFRAALAKEQL